MKQALVESYRWQMRVSALAVAGMAIAGCTSQENRSNADTAPSSLDPQPTASTESTPADIPTTNPDETSMCTAIEVPVFPGSRLNLENLDSVQKQLDALVVAKTPQAEVGVRTLFNANAIIANALADNLYAESFSSLANLSASEIPEADALLMRLPTGPEQQCLTKEQLQNINVLSRTLVDGLAPQVGRQLSSAGQVAYDTLRRNYEKFQERYQEELASR